MAVPTSMAHRSRGLGDCGKKPLVGTVTMSTHRVGHTREGIVGLSPEVRELVTWATCVGLGGVGLDLREGRRSGHCYALISSTIPPFPYQLGGIEKSLYLSEPQFTDS